MNHTILTFEGKEYKAKFGLSVLGNTIKDLGVDMIEFLELSKTNVPLITPVLIFNSLKKGNPDENLTLEQVEDFLDNDGGLNSPQFIKFFDAFGRSMHTEEKTKIQGKGKAPVKK
jgi:hypothetical protein